MDKRTEIISWAASDFLLVSPGTLTALLLADRVRECDYLNGSGSCGPNRYHPVEIFTGDVTDTTIRELLAAIEQLEALEHEEAEHEEA